MPVQVSKHILQQAELAGRGLQAAEYVLSTQDVAAMFGRWPSNVIYWTKKGRGGWLLPCISTSGGARAPKAYRIYDVVKFGERTGLQVDLDVLPAAVRMVWLNNNQLHQ